MKNQNIALKIGLSCVIGGALGALIGLKVIHSLWWIGPIIGMLAGYLSYEFKTVIKAIPQAWETARSHKIDPYRLKWIGFILKGFLLLILPYVIITIMIISEVVPLNTYDVSPIIALGFDFVIIFCAVAGGVGSLVTIVMFGFVIAGDKAQVEKDWNDDDPYFKRLIKYGNIITLPFVILYFVIIRPIKWLYKIRAEIVPSIKSFVFAVRGFFKAFFLLIHSQARLICGVDSLLGALIGYYFESPMIGGLAGMVLGIVNYYVVSIRILKLEPKL